MNIEAPALFLPSSVIAAELPERLASEVLRLSDKEYSPAGISYPLIGKLEKMGLVERRFAKHKTPVFKLTARGISVKHFLIEHKD